ncbi:MAG: hypothetical protein K2I74_01040, partial [Treponemataceae bacterium]|nr:hypothetical protein [Treponemataceae bacterium]
MQQRHETEERTSFVVPIIVGIITLFAVVFVIYRMQVDAIQEKKARTRGLVRSVSYSLQITLDEYFDITQFLRTYIVKHDGKVSDFQNIAESLYLESSCIDSIQLAPDGIVTYSYPPQRENE